MTRLGKVALAAAVAVGAIGVTASAASARVVCNRWGDCWHVRDHYVYRPAYGLVIHDDNWRWRDGDRHYRWREHEGRGYWRRGVWIRF